MEKNRDRQTALRNRAKGSPADGHGRVMGNLALAGWRAGQELHDRHHGAKRIVRRAPQPHAGGFKPAGLARLARPTVGDRPRPKSATDPLPFR